MFALASSSRFAANFQASYRQEANFMAGSYQDLRVWQNAMDVVECVYAETRSFPREEIYGLTSQMRRGCLDSK
jgi:23S rRNA-intervening sequence protein